MIDLPEDLKGKLWYLGSPYSKYEDGIEAAFLDISKIAGKMVGAGIAVYSPIAHTHPLAIAGGLDPLDHTIWLPLDEHMMDACCGLIIAKMDGWEESYGLKVEADHFERASKPVLYLDVEGLL